MKTVERLKAAQTTATPSWRLSYRAELGTLAVSLWLIGGVFVDGWAHVNLAQLETFFTPWHAVFYSGFAAVAGWIGWQVLRAQERGLRGRAAIPTGYGLGVAGLAVFALGGAGDLLWHSFLGIEQNLEALLSPTHLMLFAGMALIVTSPLRAAASGPGSRTPSLRAFLPALLSLTLFTAITMFFVMHLSALADSSPVLDAGAWHADSGAYPGDGRLQALGNAKALITNVVLLAPVLYLLRHWRPPFGAVTLLFTAVALLLNGVMAFEYLWSIVPAAAGGLAADVLIARLRPSPQRPGALRMMAVGIPLALWSAYYATIGLTAPMAWPPELWSGTIILTALTGLGLAQLMLPPPEPAPTRSGSEPFASTVDGSS